MTTPIYRIGNSKKPSIPQMEKMAENLFTKLGVSAYVSIRIWRMKHRDKAHCYYGIYYEDSGKGTVDFPTWPECLAHYRQIMKGEKYSIKRNDP